MSKSVLVIGSGGRNKFGYISALIELGAHVVILDPVEENWGASQAFPNLAIVTCSFQKKETVLTAARKLNEQFHFDEVDTIFELAIEMAADIRHDLGIKGFTLAQAETGRRKSRMLELMDAYNIRHAPSFVFCANDNHQKILQWAKELPDDKWIIRPDRAGGKIGVYIFDGRNNFPQALKAAQTDAVQNPYAPMLYYDVADHWILSKFIHGHEIENEVLVNEGRVEHLSIFLTALSKETSHRLEENRYITPAPWLPQEMLEDAVQQMHTLARAVYEEVMRPVGRKRLVLHPEFKIAEDGKAYMLEFAMRNGGLYNPAQILNATGVDALKYSAMGTLGCDAVYRDPTIAKGASGYHTIHADRCGVYGGIRGITQVEGLKEFPQMPIGIKILTPNIDELHTVMVSAKTPERVDELLNKALSQAVIIVDGKEYPIALSPYAGG